MRTLLTNGSVYSPADPHATAIAFDDGVVTWLGDDTGAGSYADGADEVIDLDGKLVTPAFVDAHVHTAQSGALLTGLDLAGTTSLAEALDRLAAFARSLPADAVIDGAGWDETKWPEGRPPTAEELDRAADGRRVYLSRIDGHSGVISSALVPAAQGDGYDPSGRVERDAHHAVRDALSELIGPDQRRTDIEAALKAMASKGIGAFHEMAAPHIGPLWELPIVREVADRLGLAATLYWGEPGVFEHIATYDLAGLAGDLNADGALGSRTAALREAYADRADHRGHAYLTPEQIAEHVIACTERNVQAGFHCIGDQALDNIARGFELAAEKVGAQALVAARHRLEHVEMVDEATIATLCPLRRRRQRPTDVRRAVGRPGRHVRRARRRPVAGHEPLRVARPRRRRTRVRLGLAGHRARWLGGRPSGRLPSREVRSGSQCGPRSRHTPVVAGERPASTTPAYSHPVRQRRTRSGGATRTSSSRRRTNASRPGRRIRARECRCCRT